MILTAAQLRSFYPYGPVFLADVDYATPRSDWLATVFYPWFWELRTQLGLRPYTRKNDCDNFSRAAAQGCQDCHAITSSGSGVAAEALSVGEFWYRKTDGEIHAVNTGIFDEGVRRFFEPQNGSFIVLTTEEFASCVYCRF